MKYLIIITSLLITSFGTNSMARDASNPAMWSYIKKKSQQDVLSSTSASCQRMTNNKTDYDACCMMPLFEYKFNYNRHDYVVRHKYVTKALEFSKEKCDTNIINSCVVNYIKESDDIDYRCPLEG